MKEKSCVYRFIAESQRSFAKGHSLYDVRSTIPFYKSFVEKAYGPMRGRLAHNIATSTFGLNVIVLYELSRHKGLPLPNANTIVQLIFPITKKSAEILHKEAKKTSQSGEIL